MRLNSSAQWAFRIGAVLFLLMLSAILNTLDLFAILYPLAMQQEESFFWTVVQPATIVIGFALAITLDLFLGHLTRDPVR